MPFKGRKPNPGVFLHVFAQCPCCDKQMAVMFQSVGYGTLIEARHWGQEKAS